MEKIGIIFSASLIIITLLFVFQTGFLNSQSTPIKTDIKSNPTFTVVPISQVTSPTIKMTTTTGATKTIEETKIGKKILGSIQSDGYIINDKDIYYFPGKVSIASGAFSSVKIILRYSDSQEYIFDAGGMGGSNPTVKQFILFPDLRYTGRQPKYYIKADDKEYEAISTDTNGLRIAYEK